MKNNLKEQLEWLTANFEASKIAGFKYACEAAKSVDKDTTVFSFDNQARRQSRASTCSTLSDIGHLELETFRKEDSPCRPQRNMPSTGSRVGNSFAGDDSQAHTYQNGIAAGRTSESAGPPHFQQNSHTREPPQIRTTSSPPNAPMAVPSTMDLMDLDLDALEEQAMALTRNQNQSVQASGPVQSMQPEQPIRSTFRGPADGKENMMGGDEERYSQQQRENGEAVQARVEQHKKLLAEESDVKSSMMALQSDMDSIAAQIKNSLASGIPRKDLRTKRDDIEDELVIMAAKLQEIQQKIKELEAQGGVVMRSTSSMSTPRTALGASNIGNNVTYQREGGNTLGKASSHWDVPPQDVARIAGSSMGGSVGSEGGYTSRHGASMMNNPNNTAGYDTGQPYNQGYNATDHFAGSNNANVNRLGRNDFGGEDGHRGGGGDMYGDGNYNVSSNYNNYNDRPPGRDFSTDWDQRDSNHVYHESNNNYGNIGNDDNTPMCHCNLPSVRRCSNQSTSMDKIFFCCSKDQFSPDNCKFFEWEDPAMNNYNNEFNASHSYNDTEIATMDGFVDCVRDFRVELKQRFGHNGFRTGQRECVEHALRGRDVFCLMPTGGGKSMVYQLPAFCAAGLAVVFSPLVSLIQDQVDAMAAIGIRAVALGSAGEEGKHISTRIH